MPKTPCRVPDLRAVPLMTVSRDRLVRRSDWILYCGAAYPRDIDQKTEGRFDHE